MNLPLKGSFVFDEKRKLPPRIQFLIWTLLTCLITALRDASLPWPAAHALLIAAIATCAAPYAGGPNEPSVAPGLSFLISGASQLVIVREKIPAIVGPDNRSFFTVGRLYDTVIGADTVGM